MIRMIILLAILTFLNIKVDRCRDAALYPSLSVVNLFVSRSRIFFVGDHKARPDSEKLRVFRVADREGRRFC